MPILSLIFITVCAENCHVNKLRAEKAKNVEGWTFENIKRGPWSWGEDFGKCKSFWNSQRIWFGSSGDSEDASISTTLHGTGQAILHFGNCWENGVVTVYKKESNSGDFIKIASIDSPDVAEVKFEFKDGDVLKITEQGNAIIQFNEIKFEWCSKGKTLMNFSIILLTFLFPNMQKDIWTFFLWDGIILLVNGVVK